jgi:phage tail sheath gpL-like
MADISFSQFPDNWLLPLFWAEVDSSRAGTVTLSEPVILIGQMFTTGGTAGTATPNIPIAVASDANAQAYFGAGSMLERMLNAFLKDNPAALLYCLPLADPSAGVAASGLITVSTVPTGSGILSLYVAGQRLQINVLGTETVTQMATNIAAAINGLNTLPITATSAIGVVTLTCRWKGATGNDIIVMDSYRGALGGESLPVGLTLAYTALASGAGAPDLTAAIAAMGDNHYDYCCLPYTDSVSLGAMETEYGFGATGRWGWMRQLYGGIFSAVRNNYAAHMAFGPTDNSPVATVMAIEPASPSPVWEWASSYTAKASSALLNDPARPLQTLELTAVLPAPANARFIKSQLNNMVGVGLAVQGVDANGYAAILIEASRYQKNVYGQGDTAYFVITTLYTNAFILRSLDAAITTKYPRSKLADNGTPFSAGQAIVTPNVIRSELVAEYAQLEFDGVAENLSAFKQYLIVQRDSTNPNRLNVLYPPDLINQLRTFAVLYQFRLQYPTT